MALLRRCFSLYESLERMPVARLRAELHRAGLTPKNTRLQTAKQFLVDLPSAQKPAADSEGREGLPDYLKVFSPEYLERAVRSRLPSAELGATRDISALVSMLKVADPVTPSASEVSDLHSLLAKLTANAAVSLSEITKVLPLLIDLDWLPQNDWSLLRESDPDSLVPMWQTLFQALPQLTKDEFVWVLRAISVNLNNIGMNFAQGSKTISAETVDVVALRGEQLMGEMTYHDLSFLFDFHRRFHRSPLSAQQVGQEVLRRLSSEDLQSLSYGTLNDAFFMLPDNCFLTHPAVVRSIAALLFPVNREFDTEYAWQCIENVQRLKAPIPRTLLDESTIVTGPYLLRMTQEQLLQFVDSLIESDVMSENIVKQIVDLCATPQTIDGYYNTLIELNYKLHRSGLHSLIHKKLSAVQQLALRSDFKLTVEQLLKLGVSLYPHISGDAPSRRMLEYFSSFNSSFTEIASQRSLLSELLSHVTASCSERPIYSYQYFSNESASSPMRERLGSKLVALLVGLPGDMSELWRFHANAASTTAPPEKLLASLQTDPPTNTQDVAFALWRHGKTITDVKTHAKKALTLQGHNFKSLFFLSKLLSPSDVHPHFQRLLSSRQEFPAYFLPLCDTLKLNLQWAADLQQYFCSHIEGRLRPLEIHGQALYHNIVQMAKMEKFQTIAEMTQGLSFVPRAESAISGDLLERLTQALENTYMNHPFSLKPAITFYEKILPTDKWTPALWIHLSNLLSFSPEDLPRSLEDRLSERDMERLSRANAAHMTPLLSRLHMQATSQKFNMACGFLQPSVQSASVFKALERAKVLNPVLISSFLTYVESLKDVNEVLAIFPHLVSYLAAVGIDEKSIEATRRVVDKLKLIKLLDTKSLVNYAFLHCEGSVGSGKIPEPLTKRLLEVTPKEENNVLISSPVAGMNCFAPFVYNAVLEPRVLETNDYITKQVTLSAQRKSLLSASDIELLLKIHSIRMLLRLPMINLAETALASYSAFRNSLEDVVQFHQDMEEVTTVLRATGKGSIGLRKEFLEDSLGWVLDAAVPSQKIGIMLHLDQDVVRNATGTEVCLVYQQKVIKDQLERLGKWKVIGIRLKVWKSLDGRKKADMLQHIVKKFSD